MKKSIILLFLAVAITLNLSSCFVHRDHPGRERHQHRVHGEHRGEHRGEGGSH